MASEPLLEFLEFLDLPDKAALENYADRVVIRDDDLVGLILASDVGAIPIGHIRIHRHFHPPHLDLSNKNLKALAENGVGRLTVSAQKTVNKIGAMFKERRLFNAHFFWLLEHPWEWHLFYFDQRDTAGEHWVGGAHLHLMNYLTHPMMDARELLSRLHDGDRPPRLSGLHVRYVRT